MRSSQISNTSITTPSPQAPVRRRRAQSVQAGISRVSEEQRRVSLFETNVSFLLITIPQISSFLLSRKLST